MENKEGYETLHFTIEGKWFTWWLRHLWIEGNHVKALKTWGAAFPNLMTKRRIENYFIPIVSGKKMLVGSNTFEMVDDGRKHWSGDRFSDKDEGERLIE